jgi:hypothetical protein
MSTTKPELDSLKTKLKSMWMLDADGQAEYLEVVATKATKA